MPAIHPLPPGFNPGSTLAITYGVDSFSKVAAAVAVNTTIGEGGAGVLAVLLALLQLPAIARPREVSRMRGSEPGLRDTRLVGCLRCSLPRRP